MRIGVLLPNIGTIGSPDAIRKVALHAEHLGYDSLWATERVLFPVRPRTPYPAEPDGVLPEIYQRNLGPLESLTFAAAVTSNIRLGTSVLNMPYYNPVLLARSLATLDILSEGRLAVGLGQGWSADEFEACCAPDHRLAERADEFLRVLRTIWNGGKVEFSGRHFSVPASIINATPVQQPYPPIYMAAYAPGALQRVATTANGWMPAALPVPVMEQMYRAIRQMAEASGRDPRSLELLVRATVKITPVAAGGQRAPFSGTVDQIMADIEGVRGLGADEVFFDLALSPGCQDLIRLLETMHLLKELAVTGQPQAALAG